MALPQTTFVPCPNGTGLMPHPLALDSISQAQCRVYQQDRPVVEGAFRQNTITFSMRQIMLSHLSFYCYRGVLNGAPCTLSEGQLTNMGTWLLQQYPALSMEEQVTWLRADLQVRESISTKDQQILKLDNIAQAHRGNSATTEPATEYILAIQRRLQITLPQIDHLRKCEERVIALIASRQLVKPLPIVEPVSQTPAKSVPERTPLASLSANMASKAQTMPGTSLKRKRADAEPRNASEVIELLDDSEDEDQLQGKIEAIQAKIAAMRSRTSKEDEIIPGKRVRKSRKVAGETKTKPVVQQGPILANAQISPRPTPVTRDAYAPPRSSQRSPPSRSSSGSVKSSQPREAISMAAKSSAAGRALPTSSVFSPQNQRSLPASSRPCFGLVAAGQATAPVPMSNLCQIAQPPSSQAGRQQHVVDLTSSSPVRAQPASSMPASPDGPTLCKEQQEVVNLIMAGNNVFYTGGAGCGKSTVLKAFVPRLRDRGKVVRIVAPTGRAALDINGSTTWTYAGWTPLHMKKPLADLRKAAHGKFVRNRLKGTDVLVIDEISMVENHMLSRLDAIMKEARGNNNAFGGVQLVVTGDFCQLPPVRPFQYCMHCGREQAQKILADGRTVHRCYQHGDSNDDDKWAFRSTVWQDCNFKHINLTNIHRQSDEVFIKILQKLRIGTELTTADRKLLIDHPCDVNNAVKLFPTREEVRRINMAEFDKLKTAKHSFTCLDHFRWNEEKHPHRRTKGDRDHRDGSLVALREHRLDSLVEYKQGMLVVLLVNLDIANGLVNGSQGRVIGFEPFDPAKLPKAGRDVGGTRTGKAPSGRFGTSQGGGRRARERSMEPEQDSKGELRGEYAFFREAQISEYIQHARNISKLWPIVEFENGLKRTIYADCQVNELGDEKEYTLLARTQIPLIAAWAMTIHKVSKVLRHEQSITLTL